MLALLGILPTIFQLLVRLHLKKKKKKKGAPTSFRLTVRLCLFDSDTSDLVGDTWKKSELSELSVEPTNFPLRVGILYHWPMQDCKNNFNY